MAVRRRKFSPPTVPQRGSRSGTVRQEIIEPVSGTRYGTHPTNLAPGESNFNENYVKDGRYLRPRSGLTQLGSSANTVGEGEACYGFFNETQTGLNASVIFSEKTALAATQGTDWEPVPGWPNSNLSLFDLDTRRVSAVQVRDAFFDDIFACFGSAVTPSYISNTDPEASGVNLDSSQITDLTNNDVRSAKYAAAIDERLVIFNEESSNGTQRSKRVRWSVRGKPRNWTDIGAGQQDLAGLQGEGTGIVPHLDRLAVFSSHEVWFARPRSDAFAFDFFPVESSTGCPFPGTITPTPDGTFFIGKSYQPFMILDSTVESILPGLKEFLQDRLGAQDLNPYLDARYIDGLDAVALIYEFRGDSPENEVVLIYTGDLRRAQNGDLIAPWFEQSFDGHKITCIGSHVLGNPRQVE